MNPNVTLNSNPQELGAFAEEYVADYLKRCGFKICARNYRKRGGEIDLIAERSTVIAFVEVKLRTKTSIDPAELIIPSKQKKIIQIAKIFMAEERSDDIDKKTLRFDVALVSQGPGWKCSYLESAFFANE